MPALQGPRFVGRVRERALLRAELEAALRGEGRLVVVLGEAGIGKTRTATALAAEARSRGASVHWGICHEREGSPAYWPVLQALASYAADPTEPGRSQVAEALALLRATGDPSLADDEPRRARFARFERVANAIAAAARAKPLVLVVDDLQWADVDALHLIEFLAREVTALPVLLVATLRELESPRESAPASGLAGVVRLGRSVPLGGLPRQQVQQLLADRLGAEPGVEVVDRAVALTEGNPFLVLELAHQLAAGGELSSLPPGAEALLGRRLARLPAASLRVLEAAAAMGRDFELDLLARVVGESSESLLALLSEPLALHVVREVPGSLRRFDFSHALLREALYQRLAPAERAALHAAVAREIEAAWPRGEDRLPALAHHSFEAAKAGDATAAARHGCAAGEQALRMLAFEEAVRHFERALAAAELSRDSASCLRARTGLAQAAHGAGDLARAEAEFGAAVELARRHGSGFSDTVLRYAIARSELSVLDADMNALLEEALAAAPPAAASLRARLGARLAAGLHLQPGAELYRKRLSDEATALARELGDPATLGFVLTRRLVGLLGPDTLAERLAATDEILDSARSSPGAQLEALVSRIDDLAERGDRQGLDHALARFETGARASREPFFLWTAASVRTALALLEGRLEDAERLAGEALSIGRRAQNRTAPLRFAQQMFTLRGWQARLAEVEPFVRAGVAETRVVPAWRCALANFYSLSGREAEARRELEALAALDFADLPRDSNWLASMALLSSVCARLGDERRAALLYELLEPYQGRVAVSRLAVMIGPIDHRLGALASVLGRYDRAETHFGDALALSERMRARPWLADTRFQWAEMLRRRDARGDRSRAFALLDQADAIARELGLPIVLQWTAGSRLAARSGVLARAVGAPDLEVGDAGEAPRTNVVSLVPRAAGVEAARAARSGTLSREGDVWTCVFEGRVIRLRHMLGVAHLARMLAQPGRELHALDLMAAAYEGRREDGPPGFAAGDAGEWLDARARADYTGRLREARDELDEATRHNDLGRVEHLRAEIEALSAELSHGIGLGERHRRAGSTSERARLAVTKAVRYAIGRIAEHDAELAEHLRLAVRTGVLCSYAPSPRDPVRWTV